MITAEGCAEQPAWKSALDPPATTTTPPAGDCAQRVADLPRRRGRVGGDRDGQGGTQRLVHSRLAGRLRVYGLPYLRRLLGQAGEQVAVGGGQLGDHLVGVEHERVPLDHAVQALRVAGAQLAAGVGERAPGVLGAQALVQPAVLGAVVEPWSWRPPQRVRGWRGRRLAGRTNLPAIELRVRNPRGGLDGPGVRGSPSAPRPVPR